MKQDILVEFMTRAFYKIDFVKRFKQMSIKYNSSKGTLIKVDKNGLIKFFYTLGYKFKYNSSEKDFFLKDEFEPFVFQLNINVRHASVIEYFGLYYEGNYIRYPESNLAFIYRRLINDMEAEILAPQIHSSDELYDIIKELLLIYEDFKREFLALVVQTNNPE